MDTNHEQMLDALDRIAAQEAPVHPYHNKQHLDEVAWWVRFLAQEESLGEEDIFDLVSGAKIHDIPYEIGRKDNEERGAAYWGVRLPGIGYSPRKVERIQGLLLSTREPRRPEGVLEMLLHDADFANVGTPHFWEKTELVRREFGLERKSYYTQDLPAFLDSMRFYSPSGQRILSPGLQENRRLLDRYIREERF